MIVVNRMDRDRADANRVLESLTNAFGRAVTPLQLPIGSEKSLRGIVDLVRMKAYTYDMGGNGKGKEGPIPADMAGVAQEAHERLVELIAEGKDELMEEFFEKGTIPEEDLVPALHETILEDKLFHVLFTSAPGNTMAARYTPIRYPMVQLPEPAITFAIAPKSRADEDKLGVGLHKLMEEDAMLRFFRDPQTKEFLIAGTGQQHIEVVVSKMKKRYHAEVVLKAPKVPYRETIRGKADVQGRHKKQTGGHGQYGDCKIKMEPLPRNSEVEFEFVNDIFGGAIPRNFIPAVEKGIKYAATRGYLAGYPVVIFRAILYDGSYHDVDSNDLSFQMAGRIAFRKAMEVAKPTLLEPIMHVEISIPDEFAGTIMGDLNSRRGRIQGMDNKAGNTIVKAEVPMAEMLTYGADLTSMTQGRGSFSMEMDHYDNRPRQLPDKIIEKAKAERGEVKEEEE